MATLEKIRKRSVLLLVIIGAALVAFIIGDFLKTKVTKKDLLKTFIKIILNLKAKKYFFLRRHFAVAVWATAPTLLKNLKQIKFSIQSGKIG